MTEQKRETYIELCQTRKIRLGIPNTGGSLSIEYTYSSESLEDIQRHQERSITDKTDTLSTEAKLEAKTPYEVLWSEELRRALRQALCAYFDEEELRTLCFDLGIDYDSLRGEGKETKARELIAYMHRRGELERLITAIRRERGGVI